jgi:hypothetical protein
MGQAAFCLRKADVLLDNPSYEGWRAGMKISLWARGRYFEFRSNIQLCQSQRYSRVHFEGAAGPMSNI